MLENMDEAGGNIQPFLERAKDRDDTFRLMGFGHRVYKTYDPRAKIMKSLCDKLLDKLQLHDPLLDIAKKLEEVTAGDDYFLEHNLYPNVDFYSGIVLRALGIPTNMFTVMFAIGRLPGWIAHWVEDTMDPKRKLYPSPAGLYRPEHNPLCFHDRTGFNAGADHGRPDLNLKSDRDIRLAC